MIAKSLLLIYCLLTASPSARDGSITGTVVNTSSGKMPASRAEVVLRVRVHGEELICDQTITDDQGRFVFHKLPLGEEYNYMPAANHDGVHYPGPRLKLSPEQPQAKVELSVCDSVSAPSPLVIRRQEIFIRSAPGALMVTESISIDNPSNRCYLGLSLQDGGDPITLQLSIPSNFQRVTFQKEFFGRRFLLFNGKLVTSIPWPPGRREVKFTYTLPIEHGFYRWQRPLDLPCEHIRVSVQAVNHEDIDCNLPALPSESTGEVLFESSGETLPVGQVIQVEMGRLPMPPMTYARWLALAVLLVLLLGGAILSLKRSQSVSAQQKQDESATRPRLRKSKAA